MDDLEKCIDDLLDRIRSQRVSVSGSGGDRPAVGNEPREVTEQEAAELVRRAVKRLKTL